GDTQARSILQAPAVHEAPRIPVLPSQAHSVGVQPVHEALARIHDGADERGRTLFARYRVDRDLICIRARGSKAYRTSRNAQHSSRRGIVKRLVPGRGLKSFVVLRLDPVESNTVFER